MSKNENKNRNKKSQKKKAVSSRVISAKRKKSISPNKKKTVLKKDAGKPAKKSTSKKGKPSGSSTIQVRRNKRIIKPVGRKVARKQATSGKPKAKKLSVKTYTSGKRAGRKNTMPHRSDERSVKAKRKPTKKTQGQKRNLKPAKKVVAKKKVVKKVAKKKISVAEKKILSKRLYAKRKMSFYKKLHGELLKRAGEKKVLKKGTEIPDLNRKIYFNIPLKEKLKRGRKPYVKGKRGKTKKIKTYLDSLLNLITKQNTLINYYNDFLVFKFKRKIKKPKDFEQVQERKPETGIFRIAIGGWWRVQHDLFDTINELRKNIKESKGVDFNMFDGIDMDKDVDHYLMRINELVTQMDSSEDYCYVIINFQNNELESKIAKSSNAVERDFFAKNSATVGQFIKKIKSSKFKK